MNAKHNLNRIAALALAALVAVPGAGAYPDDARGPHSDKTLSPYFVVSGGDPSVDRLPLESTKVRASVTGVIAAVTVQQRYKNAGTRPINAVYVFPASTRAAVHGMTMRIGSVLVRAKIKEKEKAKEEFEKAKSEGKSASLLEQERPNVFRMSVANVMPGDEIDVTLEYSELLVPEEGVYTFVYPTVVGPRYSEQKESSAPASEDWIKSPYTRQGVAPSSILDIRTTVSAGMPIDSLASPSHKIVAKWDSPAKAETTLAAEEAQGGNRDFVLRYKLRGGEIQSGLILHEGDDENFFLLTVQPPKRVRLEAIPPREYVFVVDVSGSMNGFPLNTSKTLLRDLIGRLRPTDTFNVIFFSGGSQIFAPESVPANPQNIALALHMLSGQRGGGGTQLLSALQRAMALPHKDGWSRNFIVVTDGYIGEEAAAFQYIRDHLDGANVYSFGIGSSVNRFLIEGVAKAGLGEPFVVLKPELAEKEAERLRKYVEAPVLTDVRAEFDGFDAYDVEPKKIPDVLADRPIVVFGKYRGKPRGAIVVSGVTGEGPYRKRIPVSKKELDPDAAALAKLWARAKVSDIADFNFGAKNEQQRAEIVALGLKYSLLTEFTSFIAVYEVVRNLQGPADTVKQPLPLPEGVSDFAIGGVRIGSEPALWAMLLCLAALLGARRRWARV